MPQHTEDRVILGAGRKLLFWIFGSANVENVNLIKMLSSSGHKFEWKTNIFYDDALRELQFAKGKKPDVLIFGNDPAGYERQIGSCIHVKKAMPDAMCMLVFSRTAQKHQFSQIRQLEKLRVPLRISGGSAQEDVAWIIRELSQRRE